MTENQRNEVHEISERMNRMLSWVRWIAGGVGGVCMVVALFWLEMEGRVSSLEASRDNTAVTLERIDRNVEDLARYLRNRVDAP